MCISKELLCYMCISKELIVPHGEGRTKIKIPCVRDLTRHQVPGFSDLIVLKIQRDQNNIARELAKIARIRNSSAVWLAGVRAGRSN
jgi:hypothetical protein